MGSFASDTLLKKIDDAHKDSDRSGHVNVITRDLLCDCVDRGPKLWYMQKCQSFSAVRVGKLHPLVRSPIAENFIS